MKLTTGETIQQAIARQPGGSIGAVHPEAIITETTGLLIAKRGFYEPAPGKSFPGIKVGFSTFTNSSGLCCEHIFLDN